MNKVAICAVVIVVIYGSSYLLFSMCGSYQIAATGHGRAFYVWVPYAHGPGDMFADKLNFVFLPLIEIDRKVLHQGKSDAIPKDFYK